MGHPKNIADDNGEGNIGSGLIGGFQSPSESWAKDRARKLELEAEVDRLLAWITGEEHGNS